MIKYNWDFNLYIRFQQSFVLYLYQKERRSIYINIKFAIQCINLLLVGIFFLHSINQSKKCALIVCGSETKKDNNMKPSRDICRNVKHVKLQNM